MEESELLELEGLLRRATPPPWTAHYHVEHIEDLFSFADVGSWQLRSPHVPPRNSGEPDATVMAALRNAAPSMISDLREARKERDVAKADWHELAKERGEAIKAQFAAEADLREARRLLGEVLETVHWRDAERIRAFLGERSDREVCGACLAGVLCARHAGKG